MSLDGGRTEGKDTPGTEGTPSPFMIWSYHDRPVPLTVESFLQNQENGFLRPHPGDRPPGLWWKPQ